MNKFKEYLKNLPKRWFIDAFSGMAQGLFCTLIAGTILAQIAGWIGNNYIGNTLLVIANIAKSLMGVGIGVGIAYSLNKSKLIVFSAAFAGFVGAFADKLMVGSALFEYLKLGTPGNPIGSYVVTILCVEIASLYAGKTKLDIILIPIGMLLLSFVGVFVSYPFIWLVNALGKLIALATNATPFVMGVIISVSLGILLTMPTSSAAIWISIATPVLTGTDSQLIESMLLAGGAAVVGCSCHMIGFAVTSFRDNGVSGLISQGLGTSMLQIPNIMKKPVIMLPEIISSAILGPIATCLFKFKCNATGGGMGTSGLVGVFSSIESNGDYSVFMLIISITLLLFVLPAILSYASYYFFRKKNMILDGDMKL